MTGLYSRTLVRRMENKDLRVHQCGATKVNDCILKCFFSPLWFKKVCICVSQVKMGNLNFSLGRVQYDSQAQSTFPMEAQVGVGVGASIVALIVLIIVLIYR